MVRITRLSATATAIVSLFTVVSADLKILNPGGPNLWWVEKSVNTLAWTCNDSPYASYTVYVANSDPKILPDHIAILANEPNFDCSKTITVEQQNLAAGTGYTVQLANILNGSDIYATSDPFEIKPLGSTYPTSSVVVPSATGSGGASATNTSSGASATKSSGASSLKHSASIGLAALGAAILGSLVA